MLVKYVLFSVWNCSLISQYMFLTSDYRFAHSMSLYLTPWKRTHLYLIGDSRTSNTVMSYRQWKVFLLSSLEIQKDYPELWEVQELGWPSGQSGGGSTGMTWFLPHTNPLFSVAQTIFKQPQKQVFNQLEYLWAHFTVTHGTLYNLGVRHPGQRGSSELECTCQAREWQQQCRGWLQLPRPSQLRGLHLI